MTTVSFQLMAKMKPMQARTLRARDEGLMTRDEGLMTRDEGLMTCDE